RRWAGARARHAAPALAGLSFRGAWQHRRSRWFYLASRSGPGCFDTALWRQCRRIGALARGWYDSAIARRAIRPGYAKRDSRDGPVRQQTRMNPDRQQAIDYLRAPAKGLWQWAENGAVLVWHDGTTIAFRQEISQILEWLAPNGLPSFGAIVFLLAACRGKVPKASDIITEREASASSTPSH